MQLAILLQHNSQFDGLNKDYTAIVLFFLFHGIRHFYQKEKDFKISSN